MIDRGWLVVTEFDDHPDFMRGLNRPDLVSFQGVHAVQVTTPVLAELLRDRNPEMALFPNAIAALPDIRNFTDPRVLTVFFGALNRETDWRPLMGAINAVIATAGDRLRFQVVHDEGFFQSLQTTNKRFTPLCDFDTYMDLLGTSGEFLSLPLDDTPFNRAKSDLKFIEAGAPPHRFAGQFRGVSRQHRAWGNRLDFQRSRRISPPLPAPDRDPLVARHRTRRQRTARDQPGSDAGPTRWRGIAWYRDL